VKSTDQMCSVMMNAQRFLCGTAELCILSESLLVGIRRKGLVIVVLKQRLFKRVGHRGGKRGREEDALVDPRMGFRGGGRMLHFGRRIFAGFSQVKMGRVRSRSRRRSSLRVAHVVCLECHPGTGNFTNSGMRGRKRR
jgi:hypothetical protein